MRLVKLENGQLAVIANEREMIVVFSESGEKTEEMSPGAFRVREGSMIYLWRSRRKRDDAWDEIRTLSGGRLVLVRKEESNG